MDWECFLSLSSAHVRVFVWLWERKRNLRWPVTNRTTGHIFSGWVFSSWVKRWKGNGVFHKSPVKMSDWYICLVKWFLSSLLSVPLSVFLAFPVGHRRAMRQSSDVSLQFLCMSVKAKRKESSKSQPSAFLPPKHQRVHKWQPKKSQSCTESVGAVRGWTVKSVLYQTPQTYRPQWNRRHQAFWWSSPASSSLSDWMCTMGLSLSQWFALLPSQMLV